MKLSIIIPCFNEENTILQLIDQVCAVPIPDMELIVIDDGSTDNSRKLLVESATGRAKLIFHDHNCGKGAALRSGFKAATGDIFLIQDADLEYDPAEYLELIQPIVNGKADIVYGSRFSGGKPHRGAYFWHAAGNRFLTLLSNIFTGLNLTDVHTCYKVFRREVIDKINFVENGFAFDQEFTAKVAKSDFVVYEVAVSYNGRTFREGKKVRWRDGFEAIWAVLKYH